MSYELLCTAVIKQAVNDIENYIIYGDDPDGRVAYSWVKKESSYTFDLYASATCGADKMRELINEQIKEIRTFKRWLKKEGIEPILQTVGGKPYRNSKAVSDARRRYKSLLTIK